MEEEKNDDVTGFAACSADSRTNTDISTEDRDLDSKPVFLANDVEIGDVVVLEAREEPGPPLMKSPEVKCELPDDPMEMEVSEVNTQDCGDTQFHLDRHETILSEEEPFACNLCDYIATQKNQLARHMKSHNKSSKGEIELKEEAKLLSTNDPLQSGLIEMNSMNNHLFESGSPGGIGSDVLMPDSQDQPSNDALQLALKVEEHSLPDDPELYGVDDNLPEYFPSGKIVTENVGFPCSKGGPSNGPLRLKTSEEHSQDSGPSWSSGPKEIPVQNKRFACEVCGYKTNKKGTFEDHLRIHTGEKPFACDSCDYRSSSKHTLGKHKKTHSREQPIKCGLCDYRGSKRSLPKHMTTHTIDGTPDDPSGGPRSCGPEEIPVIKRFTCDICGYNTDGKGRYVDHLRTHTGEKPFTCDSCDYKASSKSLLAQHKYVHTCPKPFKCDLCDYSGSARSDLSRHMNTHVSGYTLHKGLFTPSDDPLQVHGPPVLVKLVSSNDPSQYREVYIVKEGRCESSRPEETLTGDVGMPCSKADSEQMEVMNNHDMDVTANDPSDPSRSVCGYNADGKTAFEDHLGTHTGEKPFACDSCDYRGSSKGLLAQHKNMHTWQKPFKCGLCDYSGCTSSDLSRHMNTHVSGYALHKGVFTPSDPLQVHGSPVIVKLASPNAPLQLNEMCSTNVDLSESSQPEESVTEHIEIPCSKDDTPQVELANVDEPLNDPSHALPQTTCTIYSSDYEATNITDVEPRMSITGSAGAPGATVPNIIWRLNSAAASDGFEETRTNLLAPTDDALEDVTLPDSSTESSNGPPGSSLKDAYEGPASGLLQIELSEEQGQDSNDNADTSCNLEIEAVDTGSKRFKCSVCKYTNNKRHEVEVHLRNHTGETPFACDLCDKKYIAKKTLNRHRKVHHGEKPLGCGSCDFISTNQSDLAEHTKTHIKSETENDSFEARDVKHASLSNSFVPSQTESSEASFEPTNRPLKSEQSEEHSHDVDPAWSHELISGNNCFTCNVCGFKTQQECNLEGHLMTHTEEKLFACEFCGRKYNAKRTLDRHIRECHGENLFGCGLCDYRAVKKSDVIEHMKTHIKSETANDSWELLDVNEVSNYSGPSENSQPENDPLKTEFNGAHYESANDPLRMELSEEHSRDSSLSRSSEAEAMGTKDKRFTCDVCGYKTNRKYEFTVHMRTHTGEKPYGCSLCDYRSIKKSYVNKHMKTHSRNEASNGRSRVEMNEPKPVVFTCPLTSPLELNEVSENIVPSVSAPAGRRLSGDEHFTCEHCDYKCDDITAWSQHMFEHTKEKSLSCDDCGFKTKQKKHLDEHRKVHAGSMAVRITCEFCDYLFTTRADMSEHITSCHPEKCPHACDICDFKAFNVRSLELHKEAHTKPYACNICDYRAKEVCDLASHIETTHRGSKTYACTICDYRADEESLLSRHVMSAHIDVEEYLCYYCDYKASSVEDVEQHISTAHNLSAAGAASYMSVTAGMPSTEIDASVPAPLVQQYLCYACDFKASEVAHVEEHILSSHSTPALQEIAAPPASLNSEPPGNYLIASASSNIGLEEYGCYACDYKASSVAQVEQHIVSSHNAPVPESAASPMDVTTDASSSITSL